jgi:hypothetical protein
LTGIKNHVLITHHPLFCGSNSKKVKKMKDYKNVKDDPLTFWDYAAAAGFILTMLLLIIGV